MRKVVYPSDVVNLTSRSTKFSQNLIKKIKEKHQITKNGFLSIKIFCLETGLDELVVENAINKRKG